MKKVLLVSCLLVLLCFSALSESAHPVLTPAQGDNDLWGYKNEAGEWAFEPQWGYAGIFRDGVCGQLAVAGGDQRVGTFVQGSAAVVDGAGKEIVEGKVFSFRIVG